MKVGTRATSGGLRWVLTAAGRSLLSDADLDLSAHQAAGRVSVVKHGQHRTVYRVTLPGGEVVYWKHCRLNGSRAWWRDCLRGPKAKLEYDRARALTARGVATVEPLAWARFPGGWPRGSFLITRALEDSVPLDHYLIHHPPDVPADRHRLTTALADFVAGLHTAGVTHPDLHPGNLLIRTGPDGPSFFLIDVHDIQLGRPLKRGARARNLVLFNRWFQLRTNRSDRLRFWRAYAEPVVDPEEARRIERATDRSVIGLWASRDGRCLRENRHFRQVGRGSLTGFMVRDLELGSVASFLADPDAPFAAEGSEILKASRSATVCVVTVPTAAGPRAMVYKRFQVTDATDYLAALFRPPPALRSWQNGHALIDRGLPTPRPWLVLHRKCMGVPGVGYLLTDFLPETRHLRDAVQKAKWDERRWLIDRLARWVRLLHERGVAHRDLKAANILVTMDGDYQFIDLVGVRTRRRVPHSIRVRDLTRLNASFVTSTVVTQVDRLRFLRTYLLWALRGRGGWRTWWRQVVRGTAAKVQQNRRRGRPLA